MSKNLSFCFPQYLSSLHSCFRFTTQNYSCIKEKCYENNRNGGSRAINARVCAQKTALVSSLPTTIFARGKFYCVTILVVFDGQFFE